MRVPANCRLKGCQCSFPVCSSALDPLGRFLLGKLRAWTKPCTQTLLVGAVTDLARSKGDPILENALLRQQWIVLQRRVKRPKLTWRDRAVFVVLASRLKRWKEALRIVKPETLLRGHHDLFRRAFGPGQ